LVPGVKVIKTFLALSLTLIQKARAFILEKYLSGLSCVWNLEYSSRSGSCHYTNPLVELLTTNPEIKGSNLRWVPEKMAEKNKQEHQTMGLYYKTFQCRNLHIFVKS
jgi:hypothetical protein